MQSQNFRVIIYIESNDPDFPLQQIDQLSNISEPDILDILNTSYPHFQVFQVHQTNTLKTPQKNSLLSRIIKKQFSESHSENIDPNPNYSYSDFQSSRRRSMLNPPDFPIFEPEVSRRRSALNPPEFNMFEPDFYPPKKETPSLEKIKIVEPVYQPSYEHYSYMIPSQSAYRSATCLKERPSPQNVGLAETVLNTRGLTRTQNSNHALTQRRNHREKNCPICLEAINDEKPWMKLRNCPDFFHFECLEPELQMKIDERSFPINCPQCRKNIHVEDIKNALQTDPQYQLRFEQYSVQAFLNTRPQEFDRCEMPDCDYAYLKNPSQMRFDCLKCRRVYCKSCKQNWTNGHSCGALKELQDYYANENRNQPNLNENIVRQNQARQPKIPGFTDQEFKNYAYGKGYKACPKCQTMIERTAGCPHMTCTICRMEFCYLTGQEFRHCRCGKH